MKDLEPIVAGHFFDSGKCVGQSGLIRQVAVGHHPQRTIAGQVPDGRPDEALSQFGFGAAAGVEGRVHHHRIDGLGRTPRHCIGPVKLSARIGHIGAGAGQGGVVGLDQMQGLQARSLQQPSREVSPSRAKVSDTGAQLVGQRRQQQCRSRINAICREHSWRGLKAVCGLMLGRGPIRKSPAIRLEPENLAMGLGDRPFDRDAFADVFQQAVHAIGLGTVHDDDSTGATARLMHHRTRQRLGARQDHDGVLTGIIRIGHDRESLMGEVIVKRFERLHHLRFTRQGRQVTGCSRPKHRQGLRQQKAALQGKIKTRGHERIRKSSAGLLFPLHCALQRVLMPAGEIHDLTHFGLGDLVAEHTHDRDAFFVDGQHDLERLRVGHAEETFQHMHHELHRGVVVIQQQNLVQRRALGLGARLYQDRRLRVVVVRFVRHDPLVFKHCVLLSDSGFGLSVRLYNVVPAREKSQQDVFDMGQNLTTIGFDADDTLWHNERFFQLTQAHFTDLLADHAEKDHLLERLLAAEKRNIRHYGYGIKGFTLSMIETAIEVTEDRVPASVIRQLVEAGQEMLAHPIELLPHAREAIEGVAATHQVVLITKGDLIDQERKLAQSGLGELFDGVEIVSEKTPQTYQQIFDQYEGGPASAMMVGNSMRSDVVAPIQAGCWGVYVPHGLVWEVEQAETPTDNPRYRELQDLGQLSNLVQRLG